MFDAAVTMAEFSAWANDRLYAACAQLSPADIAAQRGAFFGSILGTLNHILLVNILYRERLENAGRSNFKQLGEIIPILSPRCNNRPHIVPHSAQGSSPAKHFPAQAARSIHISIVWG